MTQPDPPELQTLNGAAGLAGLPSWARATLVLGFPTVLAMLLVFRMDVVLAEVKTLVQTHNSSAAVEHLRIETFTRDLLKVSRQICVNTAQNDIQMAACHQ